MSSSTRWFSMGGVAIASFAVLSTACTSAATPQAPTAATPAAAPGQPKAAPGGKTYTIGWSVAYFDHPVYQLMMQGAREQAAKLGNVNVVFTDGKNDPQVQTSDIDNFLAQKVDGIILTPAVSDPMIPAVKKVNAANVPLLIDDRRMFTQGTGIHWNALVGWDMVKSGTIGGEEAVDALKGTQGRIIVVEGTAGAGSTIDRGNAFYDVLKQHPEIQVLYKVDGDFKRDKGLQVTENILQRFPKGSFDAIYYMNDEMALGGLTAIKNASRLGEFKIISVDGEKEALDNLRSGGGIDYDGIFFPQDEGAVGVSIVADLVRGNTPDWCNQEWEGRKADCVEFEGMPWVRPGFFRVDTTNAKDPQYQGW
jgi:ribose transport system substrate-binding protein